MPLIESLFRPPWYLRNCHVQTILPVLGSRGVRPVFRRERLELPDGDFLDLDWIGSGHKRLAILCSGLEGNSRDAGMLRLAGSFEASGWDVLSWNYRGCSGELNRLVRSYHSGATEDLAAVVARAGGRPVALVGCSIGGNLVLKYLGEAPPPENILAAAAISAPVDLASTARALDRKAGNRIYLRRLIASLSAKVRAKAAAMPGRISLDGLTGLHGFEHFDDRYTAPMHGFLGAEDYWTKCSARQFLHGITVPTLFLSARDDPFLTPESFPFSEAADNPQIALEAPDHGGHLGFLDADGFRIGSRVPGFLSRFVP
ncbi:MAG: alpha/beta fold hydrolase [Terrimicrobiaceae bacterium]